MREWKSCLINMAWRSSEIINFRICDMLSGREFAENTLLSLFGFLKRFSLKRHIAENRPVRPYLKEELTRTKCIVGSMEAPSKAFLLFFLLPDWLKLNHLKSRMECGFSDIFSRHICSTVVETIGVTNYAASFGAKKCLENHTQKLLRWFAVDGTNNVDHWFWVEHQVADGL